MWWSSSRPLLGGFEGICSVHKPMFGLPPKALERWANAPAIVLVREMCPGFSWDSVNFLPRRRSSQVQDTAENGFVLFSGG